MLKNKKKQFEEVIVKTVSISYITNYKYVVLFVELSHELDIYLLVTDRYTKDNYKAIRRRSKSTCESLMQNLVVLCNVNAKECFCYIHTDVQAERGINHHLR